jgi:metal-dependent HD superfamily phosphatase/phosphodiesterase
MTESPGPEELIVEGAHTSEAQPRQDGAIRLPARRNAALKEIVRLVNADEELRALWKCANVNAVDRLSMSDHGPVHVQIVANIGLKLLRMLVAAGQEPSIVRHHGLTVQDAEVVVVLGALLHDVGIAVHRAEHEHHSLWVAAPILRDLLRQVYPEPQARMAVWSDTLHAIICHNRDQRPITLEAGVVRVADALDMSRGRSRIPFEAGQVNIHSVSAYAIDKVELGPGETRAIRIAVHMNNSAGIYQVDELLKAKLSHSGLEPFIEVTASIESESESRLIPLFRL